MNCLMSIEWKKNVLIQIHFIICSVSDLVCDSNQNDPNAQYAISTKRLIASQIHIWQNIWFRFCHLVHKSSYIWVSFFFFSSVKLCFRIAFGHIQKKNLHQMNNMLKSCKNKWQFFFLQKNHSAFE